jgi:hypothetical protein
VPKPAEPYVIVGVPERTERGGFRVDAINEKYRKDGSDA